MIAGLSLAVSGSWAAPFGGGQGKLGFRCEWGKVSPLAVSVPIGTSSMALECFRIRGRGVWAVTVLALVVLGGRASAAEPAISFDRDIRPILSDTCYQCHGPDSVHRQAGLRLDRAESATAEAASGAKAIVPGDAAASEMIARIVSDDPDVVMPPPTA